VNGSVNGLLDTAEDLDSRDRAWLPSEIVFRSPVSHQSGPVFTQKWKPVNGCCFRRCTASTMLGVARFVRLGGDAQRSFRLLPAIEEWIVGATDDASRMLDGD